MARRCTRGPRRSPALVRGAPAARGRASGAHRRRPRRPPPTRRPAVSPPRRARSERCGTSPLSRQTRRRSRSHPQRCRGARRRRGDDRPSGRCGRAPGSARSPTATHRAGDGGRAATASPFPGSSSRSGHATRPPFETPPPRPQPPTSRATAVDPPMDRGRRVSNVDPRTTRGIVAASPHRRRGPTAHVRLPTTRSAGPRPPRSRSPGAGSSTQVDSEAEVPGRRRIAAPRVDKP